MMARHSGSMEGRPKAEPQTCRSSIMSGWSRSSSRWIFTVWAAAVGTCDSKRARRHRAAAAAKNYAMRNP